MGQVKIRLAAILSEVAAEKGWLIKGLELEIICISCIGRALDQKINLQKLTLGIIVF